MINNEHDLLDFLDKRGFSYQYLAHPAVFTCAESALHRPEHPAVSTKNLFLSDKKGRHFFLVVTACEKQVDLQSLTEQFNIPKLRFGSEEKLQTLLGVERGSVTILGLVNDTGNQVEFWIDSEIWQSKYFLCHPLVNTATLVLSKQSLERFIEITGHVVKQFDSPV